MPLCAIGHSHGVYTHKETIDVTLRISLTQYEKLVTLGITIAKSNETREVIYTCMQLYQLTFNSYFSDF